MSSSKPDPQENPPSASAPSTSMPSTSSAPGEKDRVDEILAYLNDPTLDTLPDHLRTFQYTEGFNPDKLEEELQSHPFFMSELPDPTKPLPPLLDAFQQLKYSETENTEHELAINHKEDGLFHFKIKKYRIAAGCFTNAMSYEFKNSPEEIDRELIANLYNNRSACSWYIGNYRSCIKDCDEAMKYKPGYKKVLRRAILAAEKLGRWEEVDRYCEMGQFDKLFVQTITDEETKFYAEKRTSARKGKAADQVKGRKAKREDNKKEIEDMKILEEIKKKGIKVKDWEFMKSDAARDNVVKFAEDEEGTGRKKLSWPVLFMYPQFGETDLIEGFDESDSFSVHLYEMLDANRPGWDVENEYKLETVNLYYLGEKFAKVDVNMSLDETLKQDWFVLPSNGVPSFFVVCDNQFCRDFIDRIEVI